jgi:hypothetical protein
LLNIEQINNNSKLRSVKMRDSTFRLHQGEWGNSEESIQKFSESGNNKKGMIKARLGFIYFVVLVSSLIVIFTR